MRQRLLNYAMALLMAMTSMLTAEAQKTMDVSTFKRIDNDLMARVTKPVRDHDEGKLCALIRVVTNLADLEVRADALGIEKQEKHAGELWLYVPYGARSLSFSHEGYFPLLYQYALPIEEGTVYEMHLASFDSNADAMAQNTNIQLFVLTHEPDDAKVYIDDMEMPSEKGVFASMMSKGEHTYKVIADYYEETEGSFTLDDQPVRETVTLNPLFGTFQLFTLPENDFNISVNGEHVGVSPYKSGRMDPGSYRIHIEKEKYYPVDTLIRLREGENLNLSCKLTSFSDSLFYNRELGGKKLSFGVNASYLIPFVSSSASGSFAGSSVNYSLGDSRENVDYSAQSGFSVGVMADYKLYKNFYLIAGVNFSQIKYTNKFTEPFKDRVVRSHGQDVYIGDYTNNYEEKYTHSMIEIPVLLSYRFVITKTGSLHLNLGPYISCGLSAKMSLTGSSEYNAQGYLLLPDNTIDYSIKTGTLSGSDHVTSDIDLFSQNLGYQRVSEGESGVATKSEWKDSFKDSPFSKLNYGLKVGASYEMRGFQLGIYFNYQLSNMANKDFWESNRIPLFNQTGQNAISGYKHRLNSLEIKLGYMFRY